MTLDGEVKGEHAGLMYYTIGHVVDLVSVVDLRITSLGL
ncbi:hypothetical protein ABHW52_02655 [Pediococcus pentosaceus]